MVLSYLIRDRERFSGGLVGIRASDEKSLLCVETESNTQPDIGILVWFLGVRKGFDLGWKKGVGVGTKGQDRKALVRHGVGRYTLLANRVEKRRRTRNRSSHRYSIFILLHWGGRERERERVREIK
jgi:hypothetical protein